MNSKRNKFLPCSIVVVHGIAPGHARQELTSAGFVGPILRQLKLEVACVGLGKHSVNLPLVFGACSRLMHLDLVPILLVVCVDVVGQTCPSPNEL